MSKKLAVLLVALCSGIGAWGQEFNPSINRSFTSGDTTFVFTVKPLPENFRASIDREYYWYLNQKIHRNFGGAYGSLLHGKYTALARGNQLVEEGTFSNGLRNGIWRWWNSDGALKVVVKYSKGTIVKRIYPPVEMQKDKSKSIFRLFDKHTVNAPDTTKGPTATEPK